ncbi:Hypersensitive-induced response protein [Dionaea muscipula]
MASRGEAASERSEIDEIRGVNRTSGDFRRGLDLGVLGFLWPPREVDKGWLSGVGFALQPLGVAVSADQPSDDNVFVTVVASVQYQALAEKAADAYYKLSNTRAQIQAYVFDGSLHIFRKNLRIF